jgi:asparagine synthase (glutamine-hydrolysing)
MCGISAIFSYHSAAPPLDRVELRAIRDHMAARGPDGKGEWYSADGRVGLGHRRLSIIDLSDRAAQPMAGADGQLVISFNGEIYNYRELKKDLEARGRVFRTGSDTEVLLQLYAEKGEAMLHELRGMYAIAIWDDRRKAMFLARDPFGIKPLYYADDGRTFRLASQVKALLAGGKLDTAPEPAGHAGFFLWGSVPEPWTLYRGIRSLPAGHWMRVNDQGPEKPKAFCRISDLLEDAAGAPVAGSREQASAVVSAAIRESVRAHLVADVPVGVFLSAGLDSATIASVVAASGTLPRTLTLGFDEYAGTPEDEVPLAERLARDIHAQHSTVWIKKREFENQSEALFRAMDQPSIDGVNTWFVARAAASKGLKVALSGLGGDELFASYPSFRDIPRMNRLAGPLTRIPGIGRGLRRLLAPVISRFASPKYAGLLEYGGSLGGAYLLRRGLFMPWELTDVLDPDMARQGWQDLHTLEQLDQTVADARHPTPDTRSSVTALEMSWYMRNQLLRDADWAGMAHSLEIRVPFVDLPLLRSAAPRFAARPEIKKTEVVVAAAPQIPAELLARPKTGFSVPVREWIAPRQGAWRDRGLRGWARHVHEQYLAQAV